MRPESTDKNATSSPRPSRASFSGGLGLRELPSLWHRDWKRAYAILTREHDEAAEPTGRVRRFFYRAKILFLELAYKLSPPRRLLFALCLVLAVLGLDTETIEPTGDAIEVWEHPALLVASVAGLVFLLVLELADRILVRDELEVARQLQRDLLPLRPPDLEGYEFVFSYRSANTVGGDYYDFLLLNDGRLALVSADASGHGIASALLMAIANTTLQMAVDADPKPQAVASLVNKALLRTGGTRSFLTLFYGLLEPASGRLDFVCAGHPFPFLRRREGRIEKLGTGSFPLGIRSDVKLTDSTTVVGKGDLLMLYTDGLPEALGESGEAFGFERLERSLALGGSAGAVHERVLSDLAAFEGDEGLRDDRSLVVVERRE